MLVVSRGYWSSAGTGLTAHSLRLRRVSARGAPEFGAYCARPPGPRVECAESLAPARGSGDRAGLVHRNAKIDGDRLRSVGGAELREDVLDVRLDCAHGDHEAVAISL